MARIREVFLWFLFLSVLSVLSVVHDLSDFEAWLRSASDFDLAHINLTGSGGGDQGGAVFGEAKYCLVGDIDQM